MTKVVNNSTELPELVFPKNSFPKLFVDIIDQLHDKLNLSYDYLGTSLIYALSLAIGNSFKLQVRKKWTEPPICWAVIVGSAGINKTSPLDIMLEPFKKMDSEYSQIYKKDLERYKLKQETNRTKGEKVDSDSIMQAPKRKQNLITDFTPEALSEAMENNLRGIGIYADELLLWINNFNRYTKSGEEQFYLSTWSGKEINVNRRGSPHYYIPNPFIPVTGTIQPFKLAEAFGKGKNKSGFTHRMLFAFPNKVLRKELPEDDVPDVYLSSYRETIHKIMKHTDNTVKKGIVEPIFIPLSKEAKEMFRLWRNNNNDRINSNEDEDIRGVYAKSEIYLLRLSLIIQVAQSTCDNLEIESVMEASFQKAIDLIGYFEITAMKVNQLISRYHDPLSNYAMDKRMVYTALPTEFNTAKGEEIAKQFNMPRRTFFDFLKDNYLFEKQRHGIYLKKV